MTLSPEELDEAIANMPEAGIVQLLLERPDVCEAMIAYADAIFEDNESGRERLETVREIHRHHQRARASGEQARLRVEAVDDAGVGVWETEIDGTDRD